MLVEGTDTQEMAQLVGTHSQNRHLKPSLQGQLQGQGEVRSSPSHPGTPQVFNKRGLRDLSDVQSCSPSSMTVKGAHVGEPCAVGQEVEL